LAVECSWDSPDNSASSVDTAAMDLPPCNRVAAGSPGTTAAVGWAAYTVDAASADTAPAAGLCTIAAVGSVVCRVDVESAGNAESGSRRIAAVGSVGNAVEMDSADRRSDADSAGNAPGSGSRRKVAVGSAGNAVEMG